MIEIKNGKAVKKPRGLSGNMAGTFHSSAEHMPANRKYKDSIFRMVFKEKKELLSLYNAVTGKHYENPDALEITTLENAIYMNIKNDLSFMVDMCMPLYEHQSTVNPNIPLRDLFYVARMYQKLVADKNIYSKSKLQLPTPQFIVFYNGEEKQPERRIMKLSDLYEVELPEEEVSLELTVVQLNINPGYNEKLKEDCKTLRDYVEYVAKVRNYRKEMPIEQAVDRAIYECIRENILVDFLQKQKWEAKQVSIFEYDEEKHIRLEKEESFAEGVECGVQQGLQSGLRQGEERLNRLYEMLFDAGETYELRRAMEDREYRQKLFEKYTIM